jgi:hypothetical protein
VALVTSAFEKTGRLVWDERLMTRINPSLSECLNDHWFDSLNAALAIIRAW